MQNNMENKKRFILILIAILLPLIISSAFLFIVDGRQNILSIMPTWNDEDLYYNQIKAVLEYGQPLGYYGFAGSHAKIWNFDAHGWAIIVPYIIVAKLFGLQYYTMAITNHIMITIALIFYFVLFKPSEKKAVLMTISIFSPMVIFYVNSCMVEGVNYFWALITSTLIAHLYNKASFKYERILLIISMIFAVMAKPTWAVLVFPVFMIILPKKLLGLKRVICAGIITLMGGGLGYAFYDLFTADYFEGTYAINEFIKQIKTSGTIDAVFYLVNQCIHNIFDTFAKLYIPWNELGNIFIIVVFILSIIFWIVNKEQKGAYVPFVMILSTIFGVLLLYLPGAVALRASYPAAVFALFYMLIVNYNQKFYKPWLVVSLAFVVLSFIIQIKPGFEPREWYNKENEDFYKTIEEYMSAIEVDRNTDNPWDNTVIIPVDITYDHRLSEMLLPTGLGMNYYMDLSEYKDFKAKYVLVYDNSEDMEILCNNGYIIANQGFYDIAILKRNK